VFQHTLRDLAASIKRERTAMGNGEIGHHANTPLLSGPSGGGNSLVPYQSNDWHLAEQPSVLNRAMSLVGGNREGDSAPAADVIDMPTGNTATQGSTVKGADVVSLSPNTEAAITNAANDQTSLYKQLMDFLANPNGHKSGESDKAEENANAVARALKNEFGDKSSGKKSKKEKDDTSSWLKGLGGVLAAMIMDPQLFTGLAETVQKILTWDNIKKMAVSSWEYMKDQGKTIIDWVLEKLGLNKKIEQPEVDAAKDHGGAKLTKSNAQRLQDPKVQAELAKMDAGLKDQHPGAKLPEAKDPGAHQSWQSKIGNFFGIKLGDENVVKSDVANATSNPSYYANKGGNSNTTSVNANTTVTASSSANVGGNRSTVNNQANAGSITNSTVSNPGTTVKVNPGTSTPPPGASSPSGPAGTGSNAPGVGSPKIGGSSFGFQSGIDDSLPLMNSTFLVN
jgi:hypothetical protein